MSEVYVINDNKYPYEEKFRNMDIFIPAGGKVKMPKSDAHLFLGRMPANVSYGANGEQDPKTYKMLRMVPVEGLVEPVEKRSEWVCERDGKIFASEDELNRHIADNYRQDLVDEEAFDEVLEKKEKTKQRRGRRKKTA